jgi:hypothetical protein
MSDLVHRIEHNKLEFCIALVVRKDPHILAQMKANVPPPAKPLAPAPPAPVQKARGMRNFFKSSPQKPKAPPPQPKPAPATPAWRAPENLARYMKEDGTVVRTFLNFADVRDSCDAKLLELQLPFVGQRASATPGGPPEPVRVGELIVKLFRLPPLPVPPETLPESLQECQRALDNVRWHRNTYMEGTLTQLGGDCSSWRRRTFRLVGARLIAFSDVTKKASATIELAHALAVEDDDEARGAGAAGALSPASGSSRYSDPLDGYGVERSFRLVFAGGAEISFYTDSDGEKAQWLDILRQIVGHVPHNPLWAELLFERYAQAKAAQSAH